MSTASARVTVVEQLAPASGFVETYKARAEFKRLHPTPTPCPPTLDDDLWALYQALLTAGDELLRSWDVPDGRGTAYIVFEATTAKRVLACVAGIDNGTPKTEWTFDP